MINNTQMAKRMMLCYTNVVGDCELCDKTNAVSGGKQGQKEWVFLHQFGGHGETGAAGIGVDGENFDASPFCGIAMAVEVESNEGRGDIPEVESFEGDAVSDDGPPVLQQPQVSIRGACNHRISRSRVILNSNRLWFSSNLEKASLDEKVPYSTGLINIDLDEISCFSSSEFAPSSCVLTYKRLLDYKIRFGQDAEL